LLLPAGRKTAADKAVSLKHDPIAEFRDSVYRLSAPGPTLLGLPAPAFKGAMASAALDIPGTRKAEIGRLCWVMGQTVALYGVPELLMSVVRSADIGRTPDIRTRAIFPRWACIIEVAFITPRLTEVAIGNLLAAAGVLAGVGDFRQEKGKGNFGQFRLADQTDQELVEVMETGGLAEQKAALANPKCFDLETEGLLSWYESEVLRRGRKPVSAAADLAEAAQ
jgi:hypothetical protein